MLMRFLFVRPTHFEEKIEGTGKQEGRRKQLVYYLKERRRYWKSKEEVLDCNRLFYSLWNRLLTCREADCVDEFLCCK
jgi:hypothetical protein